MARLNLVCGVPGCGKSSFIEKKKKDNDVVVSSDKIRETVFGDVNDQTHNKEVFQIFHNHIRNGLRKGHTVWADATNINMKSRRAVIHCARLGYDNVYAHVFLVHRDECIARDAARERSVGEAVIDKMIAKFQMPIMEENFADVFFHYVGDRERYLGVDEYMNEFSTLAFGFAQNSRWHRESLFEHCSRVRDEAEAAGLPEHLVKAAYLHDVGKLYTRTYDEEKQAYHFFNHQNVGAYDFLCRVRGKDALSPVERYEMAKLINYHDCGYQMPPETLKKRFGEEWADIIAEFHKMDVAGSTRDEGVVEHHSWEEK